MNATVRLTRTLALTSVLALAVLSAGCREDELTELIVSVDTDLAVPTEIDRLTIDIIGPQGELRRAEGALDGEMRLPATLGIVWRGGALSPINVTVTGSLGGANVIQYRARAAFEEEKVRLLRVFLGRSCVDVMCASGQTCDARLPQTERCRSDLVDPSEYEEWDGRPPRFDGATPVADAGMDADVDGCVPVAETCNGSDDDCDEAIDEDFDLDRDPDNCGTCGTVCAVDPENAAGVCVGGSCTLVCDSEWADCGGVDDGCESLLSSPSSCGSCGTVCTDPARFCANPDGSGFSCVSTCDAPLTDCGLSCVDVMVAPQHCGRCGRACSTPPRATAVCADGDCGFVCDSGFRDCDGMEANGCESRLREAGNCGACGVTCAPTDAVSSCASGACEILGCMGSTDDCNETVADGCEVDLDDDPNNCGACGNACPVDPASASSACISGSCLLRCDPGFANCNGDASDGCEVSLSATTTCGSCGVLCEMPVPFCAPETGGGYACVSDCGGDTNCSGTCTDTDADPLHCGGCGVACPDPAGATRTCAAGACSFECEANRRDCNGDGADGCEADLTTLSHCGGCGLACNPPDADGVCIMGVCAIATCDPGAANCDGSATNGCEVDVTGDTNNCGVCENDCTSLPGVSTVGCSGSACRIDACQPGRRDCDRDPSTGCEVNIQTDPEHCGACGMDCGAGTCSAGSCV